MNILIITQYYPPVIGGGSQRSVGIAEELARLGVNVTVVTPFPSYLVKDAKTKFKLFERSRENGIDVYRTFVYASDRGTFFKRMMYYLSFTFSSTVIALLKLGRMNYTICVSPPLFTGITGMILKTLKNTKFIFDIGDLWPESAVQLGFLKGKRVIYLAERLERSIYRSADIVNLVTRHTLEKIRTIHPYIKKLLYIPNFVNKETFHKREKNSALLDKLNLREKLIIGYAGNIGAAQGLQIIAEAAELMKDDRNTHYLVIGEGVESDLIRNVIETRQLTNVTLLPPVSRDEIAEYVSLFDLMIIPLVKNDLFKVTIPSKLYEAMMSEIPVLLCVDGEARKIVEDANCGFYIEPENSTHLAEQIRYCAEHGDDIKALGANGKKRAMEEFERGIVIARFYREIDSVHPEGFEPSTL